MFSVFSVFSASKCFSPFSSQDDKKFYQLELVNRETGFNKVFNSSANVGVINPLIKVSGPAAAAAATTWAPRATSSARQPLLFFPRRSEAGGPLIRRPRCEKRWRAIEFPAVAAGVHT